ncbi:FkbM family methyltransferase [Pseudomonadales bacterium]|nr:FkbM family methyltransferase [Pseudomonadales bacterium]
MLKSDPLVTIAIPTFNRAVRLEKTLADLLVKLISSKSRNLVSVYVSDNGSKDDTLEIIKANKVLYQESDISFDYGSFESNRGFDVNTLSCYSNASGKYVWFLSDDDNIYNDSLDVIISHIVKYEPAVAYYNFDQAPYTHVNPYNSIDKFFPVFTAACLESLSKIINWPKLTSLVIQKNDVGLELKPDGSGFSHVGLAIVCGLTYGKVFHSRSHIAFPDRDHQDNVDFLPFIGNNLNIVITQALKISNNVGLYEKLAVDTVDPFLSTVDYLSNVYRSGLNINGNLEKQLKNIISSKIGWRLWKSADRTDQISFLKYLYSMSYVYFPLSLLPALRRKMRRSFSSRKSILRSLRKTVSDILSNPNKFRKRSYSQFGEDLQIQMLLRSMKIEPISYLDIGANHPYALSNTYLLYEDGARGVCIEPDKSVYQTLKSKRPNDICLNVGIGVGTAREADFYLMSTDVLNTFSREEAERISETGTYHIKQVVSVPILPINEILASHFPNEPDFVSLDVEGLDFDILQSWDFSKYRPAVFCIETLTYAEDNSERKLTHIIEFMQSNGYQVYSDTYCNTIFVEVKKWKKSKGES